jgi:hypothetical protein
VSLDATTRALAVLATVLLVLAPMVNGVLAEAAKTADRLFLRNVDYQGEAPDDLEGDPPEGEPPEGEPPDEPPPGEREGEGPGGGGGSCTVETEPVAVWNHEDPGDPQQPGQGLFPRASDPEEQTFEITEEHIGLGAFYNYTNLRGSLSGQVYEADDPENVVFSFDHPNKLGASDADSGSVPRESLTVGTWVAQLDFRRDVSDASLLEFIRDRIELLETYRAAHPEVAEEYDLRNTIFSLQNSEKAYEGMVRGLNDPVIMARRRDAQRRFQDSIRADSALAAEYVHVVSAGTHAQFRSVLDDLPSRPGGLAALGRGLRAAVGIEPARTRRDYPWEGRTAVMGILNVTPDSFHDGGRFDDIQAAVTGPARMV